LSRFQAPERITRDANLLCVAIIAHERAAGAYGIQANAKLTHGHVRPIVVEPIRRRPLETKQGRISTNSAASRISDTGGTLVPNESEPQQAGGERPLSTQAVVRTLRRMFKVARRASADQARLRRADQYAIVKRAYSALHRWREDGLSEEDAERQLRRETELAVAPRSSLALVLIRSAFAKLDERAASKWAAALEMAEQYAIAPKHFLAFLREIGGIEGAHQRRAWLRRKHARR